MDHSVIAEQKHFLVLSLGTAGDMFPFLNIARTLQNRGNSVTFMCPSIHAHYAEAAGIPCYGLGTSEQYLSIINDPDLWHARKGISLVLGSIRYGVDPFLHAVKRMPEDREYVVLAHPLALPAAAIARSFRPTMKIIAAYLAPANMRTVHDPLTIGALRIPTWLPQSLRHWIWGKIDSHVVNPAALPGLNTIRESYGLPAIRNFIEHMHGIADLSLTLFPDWFARPQPDWPQPIFNGDFQLYDPTPDKAFLPELTRFLAEGEAPIVFTPGTGNRHAAQYFKFAMEACRRLGKRAIFLTAFREQVPQDLPSNILWQEYFPLRTLLPRVAALVHHGGIGTTAEALRAGTPQLVIPLAHDQFDNGIRVQSLGVGDVLMTSRLRFNPFHGKLKALLGSKKIADQCGLIASYFMKGRNSDALCSAIESV